MSHPRQLSIPPIAAGDVDAVELLRAWVAAEGVHVSINHGVWSDPAAWGIMLVDLARHVARAYAQIEGKDEQETLSRIRLLFDAEWSSPTDVPSGGIVTN